MLACMRACVLHMYAWVLQRILSGRRYKMANNNTVVQIQCVFVLSIHSSSLPPLPVKVGCGAIGCEMLKNCAVLGIGAGASGKVSIVILD